MAARMSRVLVVIATVLAISLVGTSVYATHWSGSVTDVVNSSVETTGCHDTPYYFNPSFGWARTCNGGHDISNSPVSVNIYLRGYNWNSGTIVNAQGRTVYTDQFCGSPRGTEYNNAWQITVPTNPTIGTIGIGYHHMGNYHYGVGSNVANGTHVGEMANWGQWVYYCDGTLASKGPHVHTEAARDGNPDDSQLVDQWAFGSTPPNFPYIGYSHP